MTKSEIISKEKITKEEFKILLNDIYKMNCIDFLKKLPDNCIDIVVTSPPYNMGNTDKSENPKRSSWQKDSSKKDSRNNILFNEGYSDFDDCLPHSVYVKQQRTLLKELCRCLTNEGAIFYNTKWRIYDGEVETLNDIVQGFPVRQVLLWHKSSTLVYNERLFMPVYEVIYFITKGNYKSGNKTKLTKFGSVLGDVWSFIGDRDNKHPAPFPIELPYSAIHSIDRQGKKRMVVYDPYMGSGTTACAAIGDNCDFIGTDVSDEYIDMAKKRIERNKLSPETRGLENLKEKVKEFKKMFNPDDKIKINKISF